MIDNIPFEKGFEPKGFRVLCTKNATTKVIAFTGEWKGRANFNIREIWQNNGVWSPGKGVQVPLEEAKTLLSVLSTFELPK